MLLITPHDNAPHLATVSNGELIYLLALADFQPAIWHRWRDGVLFLDKLAKAFRLVMQDGRISNQIWPMPVGMYFEPNRHCMAIVGDRLYLSGHYFPNKGPSLISCSLAENVTNWSVCYPIELQHRKEIDALVINDKQLIAVDNEVHPKYLFYMNDADKEMAKASVVELDSHGTYENIYSAAQCQTYLSVLSGTDSEYGKGAHLFLLDSSDFKQCGLLSVHEDDDKEGQLLIESNVHNSILSHASNMQALTTCSEYLVLACGINGLVITTPNRIINKNSAKREDGVNISGSIACQLSLIQLHLHQLQGQHQLRLEIKAVESVTSAGTNGIVVALTLFDDSSESLFVSWEYLKKLLP